MGRRDADKENIRKIQTTGEDGESYYITLPKTYVRQLGWQKNQKVTVALDGDKLIIEDWESK